MKNEFWEKRQREGNSRINVRKCRKYIWIIHIEQKLLHLTSLFSLLTWFTILIAIRNCLLAFNFLLLYIIVCFYMLTFCCRKIWNFRLNSQIQQRISIVQWWVVKLEKSKKRLNMIKVDSSSKCNFRWTFTQPFPLKYSIQLLSTVSSEMTIGIRNFISNVSFSCCSILNNSSKIARHAFPTHSIPTLLAINYSTFSRLTSQIINWIFCHQPVLRLVADEAFWSSKRKPLKRFA
jgi:hypothetical protein